MKTHDHIAFHGPLMRAVLGSVHEAMLIVDAYGLIGAFNPVAERLFGYCEADLIGKNVSILMPTPDRERHDGYMARYLATGEARIIGIGRIVIGQTCDGVQFPMELSVGDVTSGDDVLFVGFIRDLTAKYKSQSRLEALQQELAHVSRVSAMGTMASSLAHELNQPLTAIANYVEAARDMLTMPSDDNIAIVRDVLGDAAAQSMRAGQIVRRLRDFILRGKTEKHLESLRIIIDEANALALIGTREFGIDVVIDVDERVHQVMVDRVQIQQVLVNLIRNATEAMENSTQRLLLISAVPAPNNMVDVCVADTGLGIDKDAEAKLFTPFATTKESGMGLGLSICQTIITAHGGQIWHTRPTNGGAAFHFSLHANVVEPRIDL